MTKINRVLVPTDFSPESLKALRYAVGLEKLLIGVEILLVYVMELSAPVTGRLVLDRKAASDRLESIAREEVPEGIKVRTVLGDGLPHVYLVEAAREEEVDMIIMATNGRTGLKHMLLGSVAEKVVRTAPCPVLTVREDQRQVLSPPLPNDADARLPDGAESTTSGSMEER